MFAPRPTATTSHHVSFCLFLFFFSFSCFIFFFFFSFSCDSFLLEYFGDNSNHRSSNFKNKKSNIKASSSNFELRTYNPDFKVPSSNFEVRTSNLNFKVRCPRSTSPLHASPSSHYVSFRIVLSFFSFSSFLFFFFLLFIHFLFVSFFTSRRPSNFKFLKKFKVPSSNFELRSLIAKFHL